VVLSPKEWTLVESWYERGIPLSIIEETIEHRAAGRRPRRPPRNLSYLAPAVEEAWGVIVEGRVGHPEIGADPARVENESTEALSCWRRVRRSKETAPAVRDLIDSLLAEAARGVDAAELDRRMDGALPEVAPRDLLSSLRQRTARQLENFRDRMTPEVLEATINRAVLAQLRRRLDLPRLASGGTGPMPLRETGGRQPAQS